MAVRAALVPGVGRRWFGVGSAFQSGQIGEQRVEVAERAGCQRLLEAALELVRAEAPGHVVGLEQIHDPPAVVVAGADVARWACIGDVKADDLSRRLLEWRLVLSLHG